MFDILLARLLVPSEYAETGDTEREKRRETAGAPVKTELGLIS